MTGMGRLPLLALAAIVGALFAVPVGASAAEWTKEGEPLTEPAEIELTGYYETSGANVGYACDDVTIDMTLQPGGEGQITQVSYNDCSGQGSWAFCGAMANKAVGLPWAAHPNANGIIYVDAGETRKWNPFSSCKGHWEGLLESNWELWLTSLEEIAGMQLQGQNQTLMGPAYGEFEVLPAGVYGVQ